MAIVVAALVLVGLLGIVNLIFSFGVIRRLREHTTLIDGLSHGGAGGAGQAVMNAAGTTVGDFAVSTVDGERVTNDELSDPTLVGFFSPSCAPCRERMPQSVERAHQYARDHVLAVVVAPDDDADAPTLVAELTGVARVVRESDSGPISTAFGVHGFPALGLVGPQGELLASGFELSALPVPATV